MHRQPGVLSMFLLLVSLRRRLLSLDWSKKLKDKQQLIRTHVQTPLETALESDFDAESDQLHPRVAVTNDTYAELQTVSIAKNAAGKSTIGKTAPLSDENAVPQRDHSVIRVRLRIAPEQQLPPHLTWDFWRGTVIKHHNMETFNTAYNIDSALLTLRTAAA